MADDEADDELLAAAAMTAAAAALDGDVEEDNITQHQPPTRIESIH